MNSYSPAATHPASQDVNLQDFDSYQSLSKDRRQKQLHKISYTVGSNEIQLEGWSEQSWSQRQTGRPSKSTKWTPTDKTRR